MTINLTTPARVLKVLGQDNSSSDQSALIAQTIAEVSADLEVAMFRLTEATQRTVVLSVKPRQTKFTLPAFPITAVSSIKNDPARGFGASITNLAATASNFTFSSGEESSILEIYAGLSPGRNVLQITYTGGMGADADAIVAAYPDVAAAATAEVVNRIQRSKSMSVAAVDSGADTTSYSPFDWLPLTKRLIGRRKRWSVCA